jgi:hypothetical protein
VLFEVKIVPFKGNNMALNERFLKVLDVKRV